MAKKQAYYAEAEKLYIENAIPLSGIAKQLEITEKTLREWKTEGNWEEKRKNFIKTKNSCNVELHKMIANLAGQVNQNLKEGMPVDPQMLYGINQLAATMLKLKAYEDNVVKEEAAKINTEEKSTSNEELLNQVHDILGIN